MAKSPQPETSSLDKIARLLGLLVIKDTEDKTQRAAILDGAGFDSNEIAEMLGVGPNYLNVLRHRQKAAKQRRRKK